MTLEQQFGLGEPGPDGEHGKHLAALGKLFDQLRDGYGEP